MLTTTGYIRRHIHFIPEGMPFSTRIFLSYGKRAAVDQCLYRLVKACRIIRLARGIFVKQGTRPNAKLPSAYEVAKTKAQAFGKQIFTCGADAAKHLGLPQSEPLELLQSESQEPTFLTSGRTTSFRFGDIRITFKGISSKYLQPADSVFGLLVRALLHLGKDADCIEAVRKVGWIMNRHDSNAVRHCALYMPFWMSDKIFFKPHWNLSIEKGGKKAAMPFVTPDEFRLYRSYMAA